MRQHTTTNRAVGSELLLLLLGVVHYYIHWRQILQPLVALAVEDMNLLMINHEHRQL